MILTMNIESPRNMAVRMRCSMNTVRFFPARNCCDFLELFFYLLCRCEILQEAWDFVCFPISNEEECAMNVQKIVIRTNKGRTDQWTLGRRIQANFSKNFLPIFQYDCVQLVHSDKRANYMRKIRLACPFRTQSSTKKMCKCLIALSIAK